MTTASSLRLFMSRVALFLFIILLSGTHATQVLALGLMERVVFQTSEPSAYLGSNLTSAGDVNGDGYDDIALVASGANNPLTGSQNVGAVYVFLGSSAPSGVLSQAMTTANNASTYLNNVSAADATIYGPDVQSAGSLSITDAGDMNNDGIDDIFVTTPAISAQTGAMGYGIFGPISGTYDLNTDADISFNLDDLYINSYLLAQYAGDVNSDGYADMLFSAPNRIMSQVGSQGRVWVFLGPFAQGDALVHADAEAVIDGYYLSYSQQNPGDADMLGSDMANVGDMNSDGYDDVALSAYGRNRVYIFNGPITGNLTYANASAEITLSTGKYFGQHIENAGDTNNDGFTDLAISDPGINTNTGAIYIINGPITANVDATTTYGALLTGEKTGDAAGYSLAGIGDVDNDGYDDLLIGAVGYDAPSSNAGAAYVISGSTLGNRSLSFRRFLKYTGKRANDAYGQTVSRAGDVNGDGKMDFIIGSTNVDAPVTNAGVAHLFFGK